MYFESWDQISDNLLDQSRKPLHLDQSKRGNILGENICPVPGDGSRWVPPSVNDDWLYLSLQIAHPLNLET